MSRGRAGAVVLVLLLSACTGSGLSDPAASPVRAEVSEAWTAELSTAPVLIAVAPENVYVASFGNGYGGSQVTRIERATGRRAVQRTLAGQPNGMAVGADGRLYIATLRLPDQPSGTGLQVLDPISLQTQRAVEFDGTPLSVAAVDDQLWVGSPEGVRAYDADAAAVGPLAPTGTAAYRMVGVGGDGGALLVVGADRLERLDPETATVLGSAPVPASGSVIATGDDDRLWVGYADARDTAVLQRYDTQSLTPVVTAPSPGRAGAGAALTDEALWVVAPDAAELRCADVDSGAVRSSRPVPTATGKVAADDRQVFVALARGLAALPARC